MRNSSTIRTFAAAIMLIVFGVAITPTAYLHKLFANHKDTCNNVVDGKIQVNKAGINCHCDNLVATSPFTGAGEEVVIKTPCSFVLHFQQITSENLFTAHIFFKLRGPPAFVSI